MPAEIKGNNSVSIRVWSEDIVFVSTWPEMLCREISA